MQVPSRRLLLICTLVKGVCVLVGFAIAAYATSHSPGLKEVAFHQGGKVVQTQDNDAMLYGPAYVQAIFVLVLIYVNLTWKRFVEDGQRRAAQYNAAQGTQLDLATTLERVCYGSLVWDAALLAVQIYYANLVMGHG
jgi:hypothetical protein